MEIQLQLAGVLGLGVVPLLSLLISTIVSNALVWKKEVSGFYHNKNYSAITFTPSYVAVFMYGGLVMITVLLVTVKRSPLASRILLISYAVIDGILTVCAGGTLFGSRIAAVTTGGGVAMFASVLLFLIMKGFPIMFFSFRAVNASATEGLNGLKVFALIVAVVTGSVAILVYAGSALTALIKLYPTDVKEEPYAHYVIGNLNQLFLPVFLATFLIIAASLFGVFKSRWIAHAVYAINFFLQIELGYALNIFIYWLYIDNLQPSFQTNPHDTIFNNTNIAMTSAGCLMAIVSILINVVLPLIAIDEGGDYVPIQ